MLVSRGSRKLVKSLLTTLGRGAGVGKPGVGEASGMWGVIFSDPDRNDPQVVGRGQPRLLVPGENTLCIDAVRCTAARFETKLCGCFVISR